MRAYITLQLFTRYLSLSSGKKLVRVQSRDGTAVQVTAAAMGGGR